MPRKTVVKRAQRRGQRAQSFSWSERAGKWRSNAAVLWAGDAFRECKIQVKGGGTAAGAAGSVAAAAQDVVEASVLSHLECWKGSTRQRGEGREGRWETETEGGKEGETHLCVLEDEFVYVPHAAGPLLNLPQGAGGKGWGEKGVEVTGS